MNHRVHGTSHHPARTTVVRQPEVGTPRRAFVPRLTTQPSPPVPGRPTTVKIRITGPDGRPVTKFDKLHTQNLHLIAVSSDLKDFSHLHPKLGRDGTFTVTTRFPRAVPYKLMLEFDPKGPIGPVTTHVEAKPVGARPANASLALDLIDGHASKSVDGATVTLDTDRTIRSGRSTHLAFDLKDERTGRPIRPADWLDMPGHLIVFSEDTGTFIHGHGHRMTPGGGGGMELGAGGAHGGHGGGAMLPAPGQPGGVGFEINFPHPGRYRLFAQFKRGEDIVTVPFNVQVK